MKFKTFSEKEPPDKITNSAFNWLKNGAGENQYSGPEPCTDHDLYPLLCTEFGNPLARLAVRARWLSMKHLLQSELALLAGLGFSAWAYKGIDYANTLYPSPGARPMADIDLLLDKKTLNVFDGILRSAGWKNLSPGDGILSAGLIAEVKYFKKGNLVELHTHPLYFPPTLPGKLPNDLFSSGEEIIPGLRIFTPPNRFLLFFLHFVTQKVPRQIWWLDLALLANLLSKTNQWREFSRAARFTKLGKVISDRLAVAQSCFNLDVPESVHQTLNWNGDRSSELAMLLGNRGKPTVKALLSSTGWRQISFLVSLIYRLLTGRKAAISRN